MIATIITCILLILDIVLLILAGAWFLTTECQRAEWRVFFCRLFNRQPRK